MPLNPDELRRVCIMCGQTFYARADALYCSSPCKQRAYDRRQRERQQQLKAASA